MTLLSSESKSAGDIIRALNLPESTISFVLRMRSGEMPTVETESYTIEANAAALTKALKRYRLEEIAPNTLEAGGSPPNTPKAGETWHVLRPGARACCTLRVVEVTERTVLLDYMIPGRPRERLPLGGGLVFLERVVRGSAQ